MSLTKVLILGLATWRLSSLLVNEEGPFYMFTRLRSWAGVYEEGEMRQTALLFSCLWCMSVWVAFALYRFRAAVVLYTLAGSATAIVVDAAQQSLRSE